jgi:hypothetical protein
MSPWRTPGDIVENETPARYCTGGGRFAAAKDLNLSVTKYDDLTNEQLIMRLRLLTQQAAPLIGRLIDQGQGDDDQSRLLPRCS